MPISETESTASPRSGATEDLLRALLSFDMFAQADIQPYLDDYSAVTGTPTDKYICPLTLEPCELPDLSRGHILNDAVEYAYNVKVPVRTKPDNFYGTRVEAAFVRFCTLSGMSGADMLRGRSDFDVKFSDGGPTFKGFLVDEDEVEEKRKHIAVVSISRDGERLFVGLKRTKPNDPNVPTGVGTGQVSFTDTYLPAHWVASMLKVGHLTAFHIFGYKAVFDPSGDVLRRVIVRYFYDNASREDAPSYFRQFENAVRVIGVGTTFDPATYVPVDLDTLRDKKFLAHMSLGKRLFAMTAVYKLSDKTISVTLPQTMDGGADIAWATSMYNRVLNDDPDVKQTVHLAHFDGKAWHMNTAEIGAHYQPQFESLEVNQ